MITERHPIYKINDTFIVYPKNVTVIPEHITTFEAVTADNLSHMERYRKRIGTIEYSELNLEQFLELSELVNGNANNNYFLFQYIDSADGISTRTFYLESLEYRQIINTFREVVITIKER